MTSEDDVLAEILEATTEQLRWVRASNIAQIRTGLEAILTTTKMRRTFEAMDGDSTQAEIAESASVSVGSVSGWFNQWAALGLVYRNQDGRATHLVSLQTLGVSLDLQ